MGHSVIVHNPKFHGASIFLCNFAIFCVMQPTSCHCSQIKRDQEYLGSLYVHRNCLKLVAKSNQMTCIRTVNAC